ncbi:MAG: hypothetical protein IPL70_04065 [Uliginosibacterium sp.]|nr:hypothetical protein [Uliginosibacterium sp.]
MSMASEWSRTISAGEIDELIEDIVSLSITPARPRGADVLVIEACAPMRISRLRV